MAKYLLTDRTIRTAQPKEKEYLLAYGSGLFLRIRPSGRKDWILVYSFGKVRHKLGLGSLDDVPLATARLEADKAREAIATKNDPQLERKKREAEAIAERTALDAEDQRLTVQELFERWASIELVRRKDMGKEIRRTFEKDVLPSLGSQHAETITRSMITSLLDSVVERGARVVARNLLGDIRQMYGFAITRGLLENDPTYRLKKDHWGRKAERDRVLDAVEIKLLAQKILDARLSQASIATIWIMLSTCCRIGEITQARWEHVDLENDKWIIPEAIAKNGKTHTIYLSTFAKVQFLMRILVNVTVHSGHRDRCAYPGVTRLNCNVIGHEGSMFFSFLLFFCLSTRNDSPVSVNR